MECNFTKKAWKTPELIILVRGRPEEAVLGNCKNTGQSGSNSNNSGCYDSTVGCTSSCFGQFTS